ncbi:hypothetical protein F5144DRAFT_593882 [Chaetomium tenue]|uniref:Uncharacterized protein n=1 Tax=Chaetomium tenue TaxID=1854479 RepID=A0ACB7P527_9PEZI|nr:hypothetical protein F5144DRAFT_593882 [Chaetomium globosum]
MVHHFSAVMSLPDGDKPEAETEAERLDQRLKAPMPANARLKITDTNTPGVFDGEASNGSRNTRPGEPAKTKKPEQAVPGHQPEVKNPANVPAQTPSPQGPEIMRNLLGGFAGGFGRVRGAVPFPPPGNRQGTPTNDQRLANKQSKEAQPESVKLLTTNLEELSGSPLSKSPIVDIVAIYNPQQLGKDSRADTQGNPPTNQAAGLIKEPEVPVITDAASMVEANEVNRAGTTLAGETHAVSTANGKEPDDPKTTTTNQDIVAPPGKGNEAKVSDWLTERTMSVASELGDPAGVLAFSYEFGTETKEHSATAQLGARSYLQDTAEALLSELKAHKRPAKAPLVFIAAGFGCFVVEKVIALLGTSVQEAALSSTETESKLEGHSGPANQPTTAHAAEAAENLEFLKRIATVIFLEDPDHTTVLEQPPDKLEAPQEAAETGPEMEQEQAPRDKPPIQSLARILGFNLAPYKKIDREKVGRARYITLDPSSMPKSPRTYQDKPIPKLGEFDSWGLWRQFKKTVEENELSAVCFYQTAPVENPQAAAAITFIKPETDRGAENGQIVRQVKKSLVLKASSNRDFQVTLRQCIISKYNLDVWDHNHRYPIHLAAHYANEPALSIIVKTNPKMLLLKDRAKSTPLHLLIQTAIRAGEGWEIRKTIHGLLSLWAELMPEHDTDTLLDSAQRSPWNDIQTTENGECVGAHCWIRELKEAAYPVGSVKASSGETVESEVKLSRVEKEACKKTKASLIQFYVDEHSGKQDFWARYRPDVFQVIYDPAYGIDKLFDKRLDGWDPRRLVKTCKWIHLPANNDLFGRRLRCLDYSTRDRRLIGRAPFDRHIAPGAYRYNQVSGPSEESVTVLFMPVFGFETSDNRQKLTLAIKAEADKESATKESSGSPTAGLISAYLNNSQFPLHCRRTLDQFTYHMLKDTERRDQTQVMFKQHRREIAKDDERAKQKSPVIMVDQLWLWVLEKEKTVITSLPNTWVPAEKYNLVEHLLSKELKGHPGDGPLDRPPIGDKNCMDLTNAIIRGSVSFLERVGPSKTRLEESFQSSITMIAHALTPFQAERQAEQFESFKKLVKKLNRVGSDDKKRATLTNKLFQVTIETKLLMEIMDIEDELNTIKRVLLQQRDALNSFAELLFADYQQSQGREASQRMGSKVCPRGIRAYPTPEQFYHQSAYIVFAIQIDAFPHDSTNGEINWPVGLAMALLFGISAIVILILLFLGLCITRKWGSAFRVRAATSMIFSKANPQENCDSDTNPDSESDDPISTSRTGSRKKPHKPPPTGYAPLFNKWALISRIPLLRHLWKQSLYQYSLPSPPWPPKPSEPTKPSHPIDQFQPSSEVDYPLRRARLLAATLMKEGIVWMGLKLASFRRGREDKRSPADRRRRIQVTFQDGTRVPSRFGKALVAPPHLQNRDEGRGIRSLVPGLDVIPGGVRGEEGKGNQRSGWDGMGGRFSSGWPFWRRRRSGAAREDADASSV